MGSNPWLGRKDSSGKRKVCYGGRVIRTLISWLGITDLKAAQGDQSAGTGPIGQAVEARAYDEVVLLSNYTEERGREAEAYQRWLGERTTARVDLRQVTLDDPTDFSRIYKIASDELDALTGGKKAGLRARELTFHISPGTPMMGAAWVILGKTKYPAELIQTSRERGLQTAAIPLNIAAEFIDLLPDLLRHPDASLEARSGGAVPSTPDFGDIVYQGKAMAQVIQRARRLTARSVSVLIEGESGTGKELLARAIHEEGPRQGRPFIAVNCGALPATLVESLLFGHKKGAFSDAKQSNPGHFRSADGGTLFLDEVGELPLDAQVKLLRALQEKQITPVGEARSHCVDVRVIAATNRNLTEECRRGRFREDLFYRLAVAVVRLPPLRDRKGDVSPLIDSLLQKANEAAEREEPGYQRKVLSAGAKNLLLHHPWPGNVRELENTLMRATVWSEGSRISEGDIRASLLGEPVGVAAEKAIGEGFSLDDELTSISRRYLERAMQQAEGNKAQAARLLGLNNRQTVTNRLKALGIKS